MTTGEKNVHQTLTLKLSWLFSGDLYADAKITQESVESASRSPTRILGHFWDVNHFKEEGNVIKNTSSSAKRRPDFLFKGQ